MCNYNGYVEGWAVYAENLSYGLIDFGEDSSIITRLYQINHILNLAIPARIDLGVHDEGWNRNKTNQFLSSLGLEKEEIGQEIFDAILSEPANYLSYYIGYLEIDGMKKSFAQNAKKRTAKSSFYELFLKSGPCDFKLLKKALNIPS